MESESVDSSGGTDNGVIEIIPMDEYDSHKAKLRCSIQWILNKAYQDSRPKEFQEPFYTTPEGSIHVKPRLANLMTTSEIYCQACSNMFGDSTSQWKGNSGHWSIIQVLSRKGIYVGENDDTEVTETILMKNAPFQTNAHLSLIDALLMAYISEVVSVERIVQAVRKYTTFNASSELPNDAYDALVFWTNKICVAVQLILDKKAKGQADQIIQGESQQRVRIVSKSTPRESVTVPVMEDFLSDVGDGCSLATLISFYCPTALKFDDICLKSSIGIADSLYNLQLVKTFCDTYIPGRCFLLTYEDFLYTSDRLKQNLYVMLAELFYWLEVQQLDCVAKCPGDSLKGEVLRPSTAKMLSSAGISNLPISNVTKQSFQKSPSDDIGVGIIGSGVGVPPRQPLLHKRLQQPQIKQEPKPVRRSQSLSGQEERDTIRQSVIAWQDTHRQSKQSTGTNSLLANVSIDSDLNDSFSDDRFSMDLGDISESNTPPPTLSHDLSSAASHLRNPDHPDYMELQSVTSGATTLRTSHSEDVNVSQEFGVKFDKMESANSGSVEPLLPAKLRPAKEKSNHHSKEMERGDRERRKPMSPPKGNAPTRGSLTSSFISDSSDSSLRDVVTPLSEGQISDRSDSPRIPTSTQQPNYAAFTVQTEFSQRQPDRMQGDSRSDFVKTSYTVSDQAYTPEMARAAGIPVVSDSNSNSVLQRWGSREGSIASSRSSGDYSDHESHKIHCDHKDRESSGSRTAKKITTLTKSSSGTDKFIMQNKPFVIKTHTPPVGDQKLSNTTSFAEIKRMKQNVGKVDNSGFVYMIKGQDPVETKKSTLHTNSQRPDRASRPEKKTTFAALPNQMTWQQTSQQQSEPVLTTGDNAHLENGEAVGAGASDMLQIRLKLEEKRKMIEKKKHRMEAQHQKLRQRMGKTAFLQVIQKPSADKPEDVVNGRIPDVGVGNYSSHTLPRSTFSSTVDSNRPRSLDRETRSLDRDIPSTRTVLDRQGQGDVTSERGQQRPFSREGIQQTIENVRKKWFRDDDVLTSSSSMAETEQDPDGRSRRISSPSPHHRMSLSDQRMSQSPPQRMLMSESPPQRTMVSGSPPQRAVASESPPHPSEVRRPQDAKQEDPKQYNRSLDKLNQSLVDLQGEISRLNLQQGQLKSMKVNAATTGSGHERTHDRSSASPHRGQSERTATPPRPESVSGHVAKSDGNVDIQTPERLAQGSAQHPSILQHQDAALPTPERLAKAGSEYAQHPTSLQQIPGYQQHQPSGLPMGVYTCQNQYVNMPQPPVMYSGYHTQPAPPYPPQQFPPTPPHGYPPSPAFPQQFPQQHMPPGSQFGVPSVSSPHYGMGMQTFQPPPPIASTYTVPSYPGYTSSANSLSNVPSHVGAQPYNPTSVANIPSSTVTPRTDSPALQSDSATSSGDPKVTKTEITQQDHVNVKNTTSQEDRSDDGGNVMGQNGGFFVSFGDGSPKRTRPALGKDRSRKDQHHPLANQDSVPSSQTSLVPPGGQTRDRSSVSPHRAKWDIPSTSANVSQPGMGGSAYDPPVVPTEPPIGFEIEPEKDSQEQITDDEMLKKKEKLIQMQIKRKEDQERKRSYKEMEMARKKEQERIKQEEVERKKQEDKARRELIFRQYQEKKRQQQEEGDEYDRPAPRREKSATKPRPKSMHVAKTNIQSGSDEGLHSNSSQEDLSAQAFTISPGHSGSLSCNTLMTSSADGKSLAYGGITHRRPASPDLYNRGRRSKANTESSDTGSNTGSNAGSDYAGPRLFVKPSSKSNRHIIINAISHCCLAGSVNSEMKAKVLEEMAKSDAKHFIILFRDHSCQYRSVYEYYPETEDIYKIHGIGPKQITNKMIEKFYKYNSGSKGFSEISSTKHISVSIDAVAIQSALWKPGKNVLIADNSVTEVSVSMFGDNSVAEVSVSMFGDNSVTEVSVSMFGDNSVTEVSVSMFGDNSVTEVSVSMFGDNSVTEVSVSMFGDNSVTEVSVSMFGDNSVTEVSVSMFGDNSVTEVSVSMFGDNSVAEVSVSMFGDNSLTKVSVSMFGDNSVAEVSVSMFGDNSVAEVSVSMFGDNSVAEVSVSLFCYSVTEVAVSMFGDYSVTEVTVSMFGDNSVTEVSVSMFGDNSVTEVAVSMFGDNSVTEVSVSMFDDNSVTEVSVSMFGDNSVTGVAVLFKCY
ncbi:calmodulin-regulated spectrin-associated protein 1-like [Ylistrum balloti]|uniref:calmodulin-regulated spectrin-associated protein 1-like n=1 Tax=Ylistrum balloti TaxID=509963 RepID=UPI002905EA86|nr:calmodulin-regulated spectrin-associated protein 1-like [Ylistrum balloti]